jgi:hypothetical protein
MISDWDHVEVEATVADYFDMLDKELRGLHYNKAEHRRNLAAGLNKRSNGAIERKHQNISAILIELGFPYIDGYKPLRNYQQLLYNVVSDRLDNNRTLIDFVRNQVEQPVGLPDIDDILTALVQPPSGVLLDNSSVVARTREFDIVSITLRRNQRIVPLEQPENNLSFVLSKPVLFMRVMKNWLLELNT